MENIYAPHRTTIETVIQENSDTKTFKLVFHDQELQDSFDFQPGQFGVFSVFGQGEAPFGISSSPTRKGYIEFSVKRVGKVTDALHELNVGDTVGFRGPYGNAFPVEEMRGKNIVLVGGGIGMAPLRSLLWYCIDTRDDFEDISVIYGARSVADLVYKRELKEWVAMDGINTLLTVDPGGEDEDWEG
ncbi:MAG: FAD/NAD(P)-binding protein, partial [Anaerolineae bacterium]|nr:FAD/NAD(P)-binding protein [Anaerolineae bacterium]